MPSSIVTRLRDHPVALTTATSAFNSVTAVVAGIALARALGPLGRGQLAALLLWASVAVDIASFGIPDSLAYFSAALPTRRRGVAAYCFTRLPIIWVFSLLIFFVATAASRGAVETIPSSFFVVFVVWIAARSTSTMVLRLAQGSSAFALYNAMLLVAQAGPAIALFLLWQQGILTVPIAGMVYTIGLGVVIALGLWKRNALAPRGPAADTAEAPAGFWRYSAWSAVSVVARKGNRTVDLFVITLVATASEVGEYAIAASSSLSIVVVGTAFGIVLLPKVAGAPTPKEGSLVIRSTLVSGSLLIGGLAIAYFALSRGADSTGLRIGLLRIRTRGAGAHCRGRGRRDIGDRWSGAPRHQPAQSSGNRGGGRRRDHRRPDPGIRTYARRRRGSCNRWVSLYPRNPACGSVQGRWACPQRTRVGEVVGATHR